MAKEKELEQEVVDAAPAGKPIKQTELILNPDCAEADGEIRVSQNVIAKIACRNALAVAGVARFCPKGISDIKNLFSARSYDSSMVIDFQDGVVNITLSLLFYFGAKIPEVCKEIQDRVREQVETLGGAKVGVITVLVKDLLDPEEKAEEPEEAEADAPEVEEEADQAF